MKDTNSLNRDGEKDYGREVVFLINQQLCRASADCGDLYNWLLDYDKNIAELFKEKYKHVLKGLPNYKETLDNL